MTDQIARTKAIRDIKRIFNESGLKGSELKDALRSVVRENWPDLPTWTTLDAPRIEEVQKASLGSGVALVFKEDGVLKTALAEAGTHYKTDTPSFMIPGGFINLTRTTGSTLVPASDKPEDAAVGAAREVEEELRNIDGSPLLVVDPARLRPMDSKTIAYRNGDRGIVVGMMLELTAAEVATLQAHAKRIAADPAYASAAALQTINPDTGKPEVCGLGIFTLADVTQGNCNLLHKDQKSLFEAIAAHFSDVDAKVAAHIKTPPATEIKPL